MEFSFYMPMRKKIRLLPLLLLLLMLVSSSAAARQPYGVMIGADAEQLERMLDFDLIVIEPSALTAEQIHRLRENGQTVYAYLNIGSIERERPYSKRFQGITLGGYQHWPNERWVDVSDAAWREFVARELAPEIAKLGIDGFFVDNCDVYTVYPRESVYRGLFDLLTALRGIGLPIVINGGDEFMTRCIDEGKAGFADGVNQESVFTSIDFARDAYGRQTEETRLYYQRYIEKAERAGLRVYLLEYGADAEQAAEIEAYCGQHGCSWYNAADKHLDGRQAEP